jgi:tRNA(fMet)-specific endonuclease VapC
MILLDTDHLSVLRDGRHSLHAHLKAKLAASGDNQIFPTVVSLEEQMRGWLAEIKRRKKVQDLVPIYGKLAELVAFYNDWRIIPFDDAAASLYVEMRSAKIRVAAQDLKIACIARANDALLLSANLTDFQQVPGLRVEDWLYEQEEGLK